MEFIRKNVNKTLRNGQIIVSTTNTNSSGGGGRITSSGSNAILENDIVTEINVGYVAKDITLQSGMTFTEFAEKLFKAQNKATLTAKLSHSNDVEIGTEKGSIRYTTTRNQSGKMLSAYTDNNTANTVTFSSEDSDGQQTYTRQLEGVWNENQTYHMTVLFDSSETISTQTELTNKISVNVKRKWFAGVVYEYPTVSDDIRQLASGGLFAANSTYKFQIQNWKCFVVAIPATSIITSLETDIYPGNFILDTAICKQSTISVADACGNNPILYNLYTIETETENNGENLTFTFTFKCT